MDKFKFTVDMVDERFAKLVQETKQAKPQGKPNVLDVIRGKKEQGKKWPLT